MFRLILVLLSILGTDLREEKPYLHLLLQKLYIFSRVICGLTMMNVGIFSWTIWAELKIDFSFRKCCFVVINKSGTSLDNQNQKGFEKHSWWVQRFWEMTQQSSQNIGQKATSATMRIWLQVELAFLVVVKNVSRAAVKATSSFFSSSPSQQFQKWYVPQKSPSDYTYRF